jgi:hypothetical protein
MEYKKRKHNKPISIAIKGYLDKIGGKVSASRNEIEWRFDALDWRYQKQILFAFLQSGMSDRKWAYKKLYALWDDCFIPQIKDLWESYHEIEVSWLIIRFFPIDYLKQNFDSLSAGRNYYFLYCRLHNDPDFILDKTRLNEVDLLCAMHEAGEIISDDDVRDLFYLLIYKFCKCAYKFRIYNAADEKLQLLSIFRSSLVVSLDKIIIFDLKKDELYVELNNWMFSVSKDFMRDYSHLSELDYYDDREHIREIMRTYCLKYIDQEYKDVWDSYDINDKQRFLDYLEERHKARISNYKPEVKTTSDDCFEVKSMREVEEIFGSTMIDKLVDHFDLELANSEKVPF